jgi:hypothetical protein
MKRIAFLAFAVLIASLPGCGGKGTADLPYAVNPGSTLAFSPSEVTANRFPNTCGVSDPPYDDADVFSLLVVGAHTTQPPYTGLSLSVKRTVTVGTSYALQVSPVVTVTNPNQIDTAQNAGTPDGTLQFGFSWGSNKDEIDPNPLAAVTVTVLAFPAKDGDPLTVHYVLSFTDAQTLDITFSSGMMSVMGGCPAQ